MFSGKYCGGFFFILGPRRDVDELGPILHQLGSDFRINFNIN